MPKVYESSLDIRRSLCGDGGKPLSYEAERLPSEVYEMVGVLDNPAEPFEPETHAQVSQKKEWLYIRDELRDELPRYPESSIPR